MHRCEPGLATDGLVPDTTEYLQKFSKCLHRSMGLIGSKMGTYSIVGGWVVRLQRVVIMLWLIFFTYKGKKKGLS